MSGSLRHILVVALLCIVFPGRHAKAEDRFPGADSKSEPGTGYGYLWRAALDDPTPGSVRLPAGSFLARGNGGQYAFVIPAHDLVVVNRVDRKPGLPSPPMAMVVSMLDMILKAGGFGPE